MSNSTSMSFGPEWYVPDFSHLFLFLDTLLGDNCHDRYKPNVKETVRQAFEKV
jgi:hypothetical protein